MTEQVNHPSHYSHASGVECIDISEAMPANLAQAFQYVWRAGAKDEIVIELRKAFWLVHREIARRRKPWDETLKAVCKAWKDTPVKALMDRVHAAEPDREKAHALLMIFYGVNSTYHLIAAYDALTNLLKREERGDDRAARAEISDLSRKHHFTVCMRNGTTGALPYRLVRQDHIKIELEKGGMDPQADLAALKEWVSTFA